MKTINLTEVRSNESHFQNASMVNWFGETCDITMVGGIERLMDIAGLPFDYVRVTNEDATIKLKVNGVCYLDVSREPTDVDNEVEVISDALGKFYVRNNFPGSDTIEGSIVAEHLLTYNEV